MRIVRRDLEYILKVMDKFDLTHESDSVKIRYDEDEIYQYRLFVNVTEVIKHMICNIEIEIEKDMFDGE